MIGILGGDDGGGAVGSAPVVGGLVAGSTAADRKTSPLSVTFVLTDADADPVDVELLYENPGTGSPVPLLLTGANTDLSQLQTTQSGVAHERFWDFETQLGGSGLVPGVRLTARLPGFASSAQSELFEVGNDAPVVSGVSVPAPEITGIVAVDLTVADSSGDVVSVDVFYENLDAPAGFLPATAAGPPLQNIAAPPGGIAQVFFWAADLDEPGVEFRARLRLVPDDGFAAGTEAFVDVVADNNAEPLALVSGSSFFATPDQRRGIPVPFQLIDPEGDLVQVVFQWRSPLQGFPDLPTSPAALAAALADPLQRRALQVATELAPAYSGLVVPGGADRVRLPELASTAAALLSGGLAGRELRLLRPGARLDPAAGTWGANPVTSPVALLPLGDGTSALVLDSPAGGSWRLHEVELATGASPGPLASGAQGDPDAIAADPSFSSALVAVSVAGAWEILEVDLATGAVSTFFTPDPSLPVGPVGGLARSGSSAAFLTVASSLVHVDASDPMAPVATELLTDLEGPLGVALDPVRSGKLFVAEETWFDPGPAEVVGRVVAVDLLTLSRASVGSTGVALRHPRDVAVEAGGVRLLVLADDDQLDGETELLAVHLGGAASGEGYELQSGLPDDARSVAAGELSLRAVALPASDDLLVGGGLQQARTIVSYDPATLEALVSAPFAPAPVPLQPWRIHDSAASVPVLNGVRGDVFVWDSSDLIQAGEVVLRATPFDSEQGLSTDTATPRAVRAGVDVSPTSLGGPATTVQPTAIVAEDLDGDGDLDLASSNASANSLTIFFQSSPGAFPTLPSRTLLGGGVFQPDLLGPAGLAAIDVNADGRADVVSANAVSDNLTYFQQLTPGDFTIQGGTTMLGGLNAPSDVAGIHVNGDSLLDLVAADTGADRLAVFQQVLVLGPFPNSPDATVGDATTLAPVDLAVADLDGDGRQDVVSANEGSDTVTIFHQNPGGGLPASPTVVLGGTGITDGPVSVAVADVDGDGRPDVAVANQAGNDLAVFFQTMPGVFETTVLTAPTGIVQPAHVALADVNGDGAVDLVSSNGSNELSVFLYDREESSFAAQPLVVDGDGSLAGPSGAVAADLNGDALVDLAVANGTGDDLVVFLHRDAGAFNPNGPDVVLGSSSESPEVSALAMGDIDGDGDLDVVTAVTGDDAIAIHPQFSPAVLSTLASRRLGGPGDTDGPRALALHDLDGDGRLDVASANRDGGDLSVFLQAADGSFPDTPDFRPGGGALGAPAWVLAADLDGDAKADLVSVNETGPNLAVFLQGPGGFASAPDLVLGGPGSQGPVHAIAADLDGDGDLDLGCADRDGDSLEIFLQSAPGSFPPVPDQTLGGAPTTGGPRALAAGDLDGDGDLDLVSANGDQDSLTVFFQDPAGIFPAAPDLTIQDPALQIPTALALADVDLDGDLDLVSGNEGTDNLTVFRQSRPGVFAASPDVYGGPSVTGTPRSLLAVDVDGDGDPDLVTAHPSLDNLTIFFGSH